MLVALTLVALLATTSHAQTPTLAPTFRIGFPTPQPTPDPDPSPSPTRVPSYTANSPTPNPTLKPSYLAFTPTRAPSSLAPTWYDENTKELKALQIIYNQMSGSKWKITRNATNWNFTCAFASNNICNICKWSGLTCTGYTSVLDTMNLASFGLSGSLPNVFGNFSKITSILLDKNYKIVGTIPSQIFGLSTLKTISLAGTQISGTLPTQLFYMSALKSIIIGDAKLIGTIPTEVGKLSTLTKFSVYNNSMTGTIPTQIGLCTNLEYLLLRNQLLVGTLPTELGKCFKCNYFNTRSNFHTGTIPTELGNMKTMENFNLRNMQLVGTIPTELCNFNKMEYFYVSVNKLTGPIPSCLKYLNAIYLFFYDNALTGTMPTFLKSDLPKLEQILLQNNNLKDNFERVFDGSNKCPNLNTIDVSANGITGTIPAGIFSYPKLQVLNVGKNCMHGFPFFDAMCTATSLTTLIIDGFNNAGDCAVYYKDHIPGTIPDCLFAMPNLQLIHASGIGMKTSLPIVPTLTAALKNLSMIYNMITGTIPENFQTQAWDLIELSFNKLTGTLATNITSAVSGHEVALDNNRLSGEIWPSLIDAEHINILQSNMFSCPNGLPANDPVSRIYSCGSDILNFSLSFSFSFTCCVLLAGVIVYVLRAGYETFRKFVEDLIRFYNLSKSDSLGDELEDDSSIHFLSVILEKFRLFVLVITLYTIFILLPSYAILSTKSKTFTDQYGWVISGFFFQGINAAVSQFFLFLGIVLLIEYFSHSLVSVDINWKVNVRDTVRLSTARPSSLDLGDIQIEREIGSIQPSARLTDVADNKLGIKWINKDAVAYFFAFLGNGVVIVLINAWFVYVIETYGETAAIGANFLLGTFKACYKKWFIIALLKYSKWATAKVKYYGAPADEGDLRWINELNNNDLFMFSILQILNNILIPWVIVLFESPQCFHEKFVPRDEVNVQYPIKYCGSRCSGSMQCCVDDYMPGEFSFTPSFLYYSNCSNFLLTAYLPVMFITFTFTGVIFPAALAFQDWFIDKYHDLPENATRFDQFCSAFAKLQIKAQAYLTYITPIQSLLESKGKPPIVLDINQSLLTWTTSLGNATIDSIYITIITVIVIHY